MMVYVERTVCGMGMSLLVCAYYEMLRSFSLTKDAIAFVAKAIDKPI
jgi:hypothetical protein